MEFLKVLAWIIGSGLAILIVYIAIRVWAHGFFKSKLEYERKSNQLRAFFGLERRKQEGK